MGSVNTDIVCINSPIIIITLLLKPNQTPIPTLQGWMLKRKDVCLDVPACTHTCPFTHPLSPHARMYVPMQTQGPVTN